MSHSITLELPDAIYQKLKHRSQQTKRSLEDELLTAFVLDLPILPMAETGEVRAYNEVIEFLASGPSAVAITEFRLSDKAQQRAKLLLDKNRDEGLTSAEAKELDFYVELGDFLGILRARALLQLQHNDKS